MISTDSLRLRVAQMPGSRDLVIFVQMTDDRQTDCPLLLMRAQGNYTCTCMIMISQQKGLACQQLFGGDEQLIDMVK